MTSTLITTLNRGDIQLSVHVRFTAPKTGVQIIDATFDGQPLALTWPEQCALENECYEQSRRTK